MVPMTEGNSEHVAHACKKIGLFGERILEISTTSPTPAPCTHNQKIRQSPLVMVLMITQNISRTHQGKQVFSEQILLPSAHLLLIYVPCIGLLIIKLFMSLRRRYITIYLVSFLSQFLFVIYECFFLYLFVFCLYRRIHRLQALL